MVRVIGHRKFRRIPWQYKRAENHVQNAACVVHMMQWVEQHCLLILHQAKHITVITLVPGEVAVAQYYSEGGMAPVGSAAVNNYRTRVTQVFVKEGGKWKVRAAHWSPIQGGAGTSQTSVDD